MGTTEAQRLAEEIVRQATDSRGETRGDRTTSSFAEFRSKRQRYGEHFAAFTNENVLWQYLTSRGPIISEFGIERLATLGPEEQRVLSKATNPAGGFTVPSDFDSMITSARRARNVIGELARELETDSGTNLALPVASVHGVGSWISENAAVAASDETFAQVTLAAYRCGTKVVVSQELAQDALDDFDRFLADELGQRLALLEEAAFATGDGNGKPQGVVASGNGVATVAAATGSATGFKLADVRSVWAALPDGYKPNATWLMSPSAFASLANLTDSAGGLALPSLHAAEPTLYSRPVYVSPELPAAAANARSVVVGDFSVGYAIRRVRGLGVQRLAELHSDTGQIGYVIFQRVDGRVVLPDALRILAHSAT